MKRFLSLIILVLCSQMLWAQYTVNGFALQESCNQYRLTADAGGQNGSVWNNTKIDLTQSFDFNFDVFLGTHDDPGADGIAFVLQPISTSVGGSGSGLGYNGISPAVGVTLDTYQNSNPDLDPSDDHLAYQLNGDLNHGSANNIAGPVSIINGNSNIEDGNWHSLHIVWDAATKTLTTYVDGSFRLNTVNDFVTTVFGGNPMVYWGFTGSTGGESNLQRFRTALNPSFHFSPTQKRCVGEPITFIDSTISFTNIAKFYWTFGDGPLIDSVNLNPVHTYTVANDYVITQRVVGADGCEATNTQTVRIGSKPIAGFQISGNCALSATSFSDTSKTTVGTINNWYWDLGNSTTSVLANPTTTYTTGGDKIIKLAVKSLEGCESDTLFKTIHIYTKPVVDFSFTDSVCIGSPTSFSGIFVSGSDPISNWLWYFNAGPPVTTQNPTYTFTTAGINGVQLLATSNGSLGCAGGLFKNVFVVDKPIAYFKNGTICQATATTLTDSSYSLDGVPVNGWWWDLGNSQTSTQQNPPATYNTSAPVTVKLVAYNLKGCKSDTLTKVISISAKPIANFGFSTLLCTALPVQFSDSSLAAGSTVNKWSWVQNGVEWETQQNPTRTFSPGPQTIKLVATSVEGCVSDTTTKSFTILASPNVSFNFSDGCKKDIINFSAVDSSASVTDWKWTFGDGSIANTKDTQHIYATRGTYLVKLYASASNGCYSDSLQKNIIIYGTNAFAGRDTVAALRQPMQLNASGGDSYLWTPSIGLSNPTIANPIAILQGTQTYYLKAYTTLGCESFDTIKIEVYDGPEIYIPNAFTPDGNATNDILYGKPVGLKEFKYLKIFNRYGQEIFSTADYGRGWDGTWKGKPQPNGVYVVIASGVDYRGNAVNKQQTVVLIR